MKRSSTLVQMLFSVVIVLGMVLPFFEFGQAAVGLTVEILAAPNLIVDSNVMSPSTNQPIVATVIGKFCNTSGSAIDNVVGYIGDYVSGTPGDYPDHTPGTISGGGVSTTYDGTYEFQHLGSTADATRYIGTLQNGECSYQYWSFTYPKYADWNGGTDNIPAWGTSVKPGDDLWLTFDVWGNYPGQSPTVDSHTMTMRNEISSMANKIEPNGNPGGRWFNTDTNTINVGETVTTNGILYRLGNVNQGFDNDGDGIPDYNAWLQPFGDPAYNPDCFRLVKTTGVLTVTTSSGDVIIPFVDSLYFTDLPMNNTNVVGEVFYTFMALGGACTIPITPYQEAASGSDNEKFNGDYGAGPDPVGSYEPAVTVTKTAPGSVSLGTTYSYSIPFANTSTTSEAGITLSSGGIDMPLVVEDTVPNGLEYVCGSAGATLTGSNSATIYYSSDSGANWSTSEPASCPSTDPTSSGDIVIRWVLDNPLPKSPDPGSTGNSAIFQASVPSSGYTGSYFVENCAEGRIGTSSPTFAEDCTITVVQGDSSIGDFIWRDLDGDGVQDGGSETGIDDIDVSLYWDANDDNTLDDGDYLIASMVTASGGAYDFTLLPIGTYLVIVDHLDGDLPTGYSNTTPVVLDVDITAASTDYNDADFGFAPALEMSKTLVSSNPVDEGSEVTFNVTLTNTRPASDDGYCTYPIWATIAHPDNSYTPPSGNNANSQWQDPDYALNAPDHQYATTDMKNTADLLGLSGFNLTGKTATIRAVKLRLYFTEVVDFQASDAVTVDVWRSDVADATNQFIYNGQTHFTGAAGSEYVFETDDLNGSWAWSDFSANTTELQLTTSSSPSSGDIGLDAVAYVVTTNEPCGGSDDVIATLPLTDTYDADLLQFVSAAPLQTSSSTSGTPPDTEGTITWDNLGPLYGGEVRTVQVVFLALDPSAGSATTVNTATVTGAKFGSGRDANDGTDTASVTINRTAVIGDWVWNDTVNFGVQDAGEVGIPGVTVELCSDAACTTVLETTITDPNGYYSFTVTDGTYYVNIPTAPGTFTYDADGATNGNGTAGVAVAGTDDLTLDFGYTLTTASVYGMVWEDFDGDGVRDANEPAFANVTVEYCNDINCNGGGDTSTTTDADGNYLFTNANTGSYFILVDATTLLPGSNWTQTADPDATLDDYTNQTIAIGVNGSFDFAYRRTPTAYGIGDTIYVDWDGDGTQDTGEEGLAGVDVNLYVDKDRDGVLDETDPLFASDTTDASGNYLFSTLGSDYYIVVVDTNTLPAGYFQTQDPNQSGTCGICDNRYSLNFAGTADVLTIDFGYQPRGASSIGDYVWEDTNGDGLQGASETGLPDILVTLYEDSNANGTIDADDAVVYTATTDSEGAYLFQNLPYGRYLVNVDTTDSDLPTDAYGNFYLLTTANDPLLVILSASNPHDLTADFGFISPGTIGDFIWADYDGDGLADANEPGLNGVTVQLYRDVNNNGQYDSGTDTLYSTDTTANNSLGNPGYYLFSDVPAGNYLIVVDDTQAALANYTLSADPDVYNPTYPDSVSCLTDDAQGCDGVKPYDRYDSSSSYDEDPAIHPGSVELTADFGYQPDAYVGDYVWLDSDADGLRDPEEQGIPNITVSFCDVSNCSGTVITTTTDENGEYSFGGNMSDETTYYVVVDTADADWPTNLTQTYDPVSGNDCNSGTCTTAPSVYIDLDRTDGVVSSIGGVSCSSGVNCNLDVDFGYRYYGNNSISGTAFHDDDDDAVQDLSETTTYANVPIYLHYCGGSSASCGDGDDVLVGSMLTDANGNYTFTQLTDGIYRTTVNPNSFSLQGTDPTVVGSPTTYHDISLDPTSADPDPVDVTDQDFGFRSNMDLGDLPGDYNNTLMADNGARHIIGSVYLGSGVTADYDGQESSTATGDTDDGVVRTPLVNWAQGANGASIDVTTTCVGTCYLSAWIDWDNSDSFSSGERVLVDRAVTNGTQTITFDIPGTASFPNTFNIRFRLYASSTSGLAQPTGLVTNGETEDYQWNFGPNAITLAEFSAFSDPMRLRLAIVTVLLLLGAGIFFALKDRRQRVAIRVRKDEP